MPHHTPGNATNQYGEVDSGVKDWGTDQHKQNPGGYIFQKHSYNMGKLLLANVLFTDASQVDPSTAVQSQKPARIDWISVAVTMNDLNVALFCSASVLLFIASLAVGLRFYVRIVLVKALGMDDYLIALSLVSQSGFSGISR